MCKAIFLVLITCKSQLTYFESLIKTGLLDFKNDLTVKQTTSHLDATINIVSM